MDLPTLQPFTMRLILTLFLFLLANLALSQPAPYDLLQQVIERSSTVRNLEYTMEKRERVEGEMTIQRSFIRLHRSPFKIYLQQKVPRNGLEALYVQDTNKDRILINPNGFPWINLNLNPRSGLVRRDQHHTIDHSGYDYFVEILSSGLSAQGEEQAALHCSSEMQWLSEPCWKLHIVNPNYREQNTVIKQDINLSSLADSLNICEYKVIELNRGLKAGEVIPAGTEITLPTHYGKEMFIYVSTTHLLPVTLEIRDEQGVFERYDYLDLKVNPDLNEMAFSPDFSEYEF